MSLPSWPPSSRSPPRRESYSPSMNQNTGNPFVILFVLRSLLLLRFDFTSSVRWALRVEIKPGDELAYHSRQVAVDVAYSGLLRDYSAGGASQTVTGGRAGVWNNASIPPVCSGQKDKL